MDIDRLRTLLATLETGSFTAAAKRLGVSQPAVSAQVRRLEDEAGHVLVERSSHPLGTTAVARQLLPAIRRVVDAHDALVAETAAIDGLAAGSVSVGAMTGAPTSDLATALSRFVDRHPGVETALVNDSSERLVAALERGDLDLAMVVEPPDSLEWFELERHPMALAVAADQELAGRTDIALEELAPLRLVGMARGTGVRTICDRAARDAGIDLRIVYEASTPAMAADLVALGLGPAILPRPIVVADERLVAVAISPPPSVDAQLEGSVVLAWARGRALSPAANAFRAELEKALLA